MNFLKIGDQYINMAQVHQVALDTRYPESTLYVYTSDHTIRVTDPDERAALLAWLRRNSVNVMKMEA